MPDMGDISGSVSAADQSTSASGPGGGEGGHADPSAGLSAPAMTFTADDAKTMAGWLSGAAAIAAKSSLPTSLLLGSLSMGLFSETQSGLFSQALPHLATDIARSMGWAIVQSTPGAILMSGPDGFGVAVGGNSLSVLDFNGPPAFRDSGSETGL
jgi:hypothetical protein